MKNLFFAAFLLLSAFCSAQTIGRIPIEGNIKVPSDSDPDGITIFNKNSNRGTTSDSNGDFEISVVVGDSLYFSALQFNDLLVVIDSKIFEAATLNVEITEGVNQLPEVVVRPHNLSGNLGEDLENINTVPLPVPSPSGWVVNDYDYEFRPDAQSGVYNAAAGESGGPSVALNPLAIVGALVSWILPKKSDKKAKSQPRTQVGLISLERHLRANFENDFFEEVLKIPAKDIPEFIAFCEQGVSPELLQPSNKIDLIEYLVVQSKAFKKQEQSGSN